MSSQTTQPGELLRFKGTLYPALTSPELLNSLDSFEAREDDVFLVSYPKSGTHWVAEVLENIPSARLALTAPLELGDACKLDELRLLPRRRVIPTHLAYDMLPDAVKQKQCKVIYVVRNPKDTAVSLFHYYQDNPQLPDVDSWPRFLELFLRGDVVYGSWFDHVLGWEDHGHEKNILILYYEEMKKDFSKSLKKITAFLGMGLSDGEIHTIAWKTSFSEMKSHAGQEHGDPHHTVCALTSDRKLVFRKGVVGDWINYFTPKQKAAFDEVFAERMRQSEVAKRLKEYC